MCIVCVEMAKGTLNRSEARRALGEIAMDSAQKEHAQQVIRAINKEQEEEKAKKANSSQKK
jgi:hypothetical protein